MGTKKSTWITVVAVVLAWALITSGMDRRDAEITTEHEREAYERAITFTFPIEYSASVTQCTRDGCRTRYYSPRKP